MVSLYFLSSTGIVKTFSLFCCPRPSSPLQASSKSCSALWCSHTSSTLNNFSNHHLHPLPLPWPLLTLVGSQRLMVQGKNVVANVENHDNNRPPLLAVSMHEFRKSIKYNEIKKLRANVVCWRQYLQWNKNHRRLINIVKKMRRLITVGRKTLNSKI